MSLTSFKNKVRNLIPEWSNKYGTLYLDPMTRALFFVVFPAAKTLNLPSASSVNHLKFGSPRFRVPYANTKCFNSELISFNILRALMFQSVFVLYRWSFVLRQLECKCHWAKCRSSFFCGKYCQMIYVAFVVKSLVVHLLTTHKYKLHIKIKSS